MLTVGSSFKCIFTAITASVELQKVKKEGNDRETGNPLFSFLIIATILLYCVYRYYHFTPGPSHKYIYISQFAIAKFAGFCPNWSSKYRQLNYFPTDRVPFLTQPIFSSYREKIGTQVSIFLTDIWILDIRYYTKAFKPVCVKCSLQISGESLALHKITSFDPTGYYTKRKLI